MSLLRPHTLADISRLIDEQRADQRSCVQRGIFQRATALHGENRLDEAESLYRAILKVDPANIGSLHSLATLWIQQRRGQEAVELLREILHRRPDLAVALHTLGIALRFLGRADE